MKIHTHFRFGIIALLLLGCFAANAQTAYLEQIASENQAFSKRTGQTSVAFDMDLSRLNIKSNHLLLITPVVVSTQGDERMELPSVAVFGNKRYKMLNRPFEWKGKTAFDVSPYTQLVRQNGTTQRIPYSVTMTYADWQRAAHLQLEAQIIGCADCGVGNEGKTIADRILPDFFIPDYRFDYIVPQVDPVKRRSERYSAHLNYLVGRHDLRPNFENNAAELAKVDRIVRELQTNKDLQITDFTISGYASPEDTYKRNMLLSQRRAETFATYIEKKYGYTRSQFKVEWFGEDWDGLRKAVEASSLPNKEAVLQIIDNDQEPDAKDASFIALDNGQTYNRMLRELYPPLRRNDYNIAFIARAFDVEEAKQMLHKNPKLLSLNEMYLVANTFAENSPEYNEVFRIAAETFPTDNTALLNGAVSDLKSNNPDAAINRLDRIKDLPQAANLIGIAYARKGDTARAMDFLNKANQQGSRHAAHNIDQLQRYIDDNL